MKLRVEPWTTSLIVGAVVASLFLAITGKSVSIADAAELTAPTPVVSSIIGG